MDRSCLDVFAMPAAWDLLRRETLQPLREIVKRLSKAAFAVHPRYTSALQ